jgi:hypothetical protein
VSFVRFVVRAILGERQSRQRALHRRDAEFAELGVFPEKFFLSVLRASVVNSSSNLIFVPFVRFVVRAILGEPQSRQRALHRRDAESVELGVFPEKFFLSVLRASAVNSSSNLIFVSFARFVVRP